MMDQVKWDIVTHLFRMRPEEYSQEAIVEIERTREEELEALQLGGAAASDAKPVSAKRDAPKIGRNDPCSCDSGKKYKHCHGRE